MNAYDLRKILGGSTLLLLLAAPAGAQTPAPAADCKPLHRLISVDMTPVPGGTRMLVPANFNGGTKELLLDTAGGRTTLTDTASRALGVVISNSESERLLDQDGYASNRYFYVSDFGLGGLKGRHFQFMVTPNPHLGTDPKIDGKLGLDLMESYDVEMDFANRKLNYFSQDHCAGHVVYWPAKDADDIAFSLFRRGQANKHSVFGPMMAVILNPNPAPDEEDSILTDPGYQESGSGITGAFIRMPVRIDGKLFTAEIDTGSEDLTLISDTAKVVFNVTADSPGSGPLHTASVSTGPDGAVSETVVVNGVHVFEHTFHTLTFGGVTITNPHFTVRPDVTGDKDGSNAYITGSHVDRVDDHTAPDVTIGMNVLRKLHLYFAFGEKKLYVTSAGG